MNKKKKRYKKNIVYILEIFGCQYYIGCQCRKSEVLESELLLNSGNPLNKAHRAGLITLEEYKDNCQVLYIEEYDKPEEALNREIELIIKFKEKYGERCLNKSMGNKYGFTGLHHSIESRKRNSEAHITQRPTPSGNTL